MQSNNPVFRRSEEFNGRVANAYGNQTYAGNGAGLPGLRRAARLCPARHGARPPPGGR